MAVTIKFKRGELAGLPPLDTGEVAFALDKGLLYVGDGNGNVQIGHDKVAKGGDTMTGRLTLSGDPTIDLHAATKAYADGKLSLSGGTLRGALRLPLSPPVHPNQAANKAYVDNVASGLDVKASVKCVATANQRITSVDENMAYEYDDFVPVTIDGYTLAVKDRILLVGQDNYMQNGIFVVMEVGDGTSPCLLSRPEDARDGTLTGGAFVFVEQGTTYADTGWVCTTDEDPIIIGSTLIEFTQFTGAGSASFVALSDTPSSYASQGGKSVRVNEAADGLEFVDSTFLNLDDTPSTYASFGKHLVQVNQDATGLEYVAEDTVGRKTFSALDDTPSALVANQVPVVNSAGTKLVFVDKTTLGIQKIEQFGDFAGPYTGNIGRMLRVHSSGNKLEYFDAALVPDVNNGGVPIASSWAAEHQELSTGVHGAPSNKSLLHEDSIIDGGTFV